MPSSQTLDFLAEESLNNFADMLVDMASVAKILELIGTSEEGWEAAAQAAVKEALKTIHGISGVEVVDMTAKVDMQTGKITQYRTTVKIAFGVDKER